MWCESSAVMWKLPVARWGTMFSELMCARGTGSSHTVCQMPVVRV